MYQAYLEYHNDGLNSHKFWSVDVRPRAGHTGEWYLITKWGRCGTAGQEKIQTLYSEWRADREAEAAARKKEAKGYQRTRKGTYQAPISEPKIPKRRGKPNPLADEDLII